MRKQILPILSILVITAILILWPRYKSQPAKQVEQVLSVETRKPTPTPFETIIERDQENFGSFLVPKDLQ